MLIERHFPRYHRWSSTAASTNTYSVSVNATSPQPPLAPTASM